MNPVRIKKLTIILNKGLQNVVYHLSLFNTFISVEFVFL